MVIDVDEEEEETKEAPSMSMELDGDLGESEPAMEEDDTFGANAFMASPVLKHELLLDTSPTTRAFELEVEYILRCTSKECGYTRTVVERFFDLSLDFPLSSQRPVAASAPSSTSSSVSNDQPTAVPFVRPTEEVGCIV